jgi:hypothetical protein
MFGWIPLSPLHEGDIFANSPKEKSRADYTLTVM